MIGYLALIAYAATIPAANWLIANVGICAPQAPCVIPVGFGLMAPSGVLMIGAALVLRDVVQETLGTRPALAAVAAGSALTWLVASPALATASLLAFALAELADMAVYSPIRRRNLPVAVVLSGLVGSIIDSAVFLLLAFGSLQFIEGQIVGKLWASLGGGLLIWLVRQLRRETA